MGGESDHGHNKLMNSIIGVPSVVPQLVCHVNDKIYVNNFGVPGAVPQTVCRVGAYSWHLCAGCVTHDWCALWVTDIWAFD